MFQRKPIPYGTPQPPGIRDWLFNFLLASGFLTYVSVALYRGQFPSRRLHSVTAEHDPLFFWAYQLILGTIALVLLYLAITEFKEWRRNAGKGRS